MSISSRAAGLAAVLSMLSACGPTTAAPTPAAAQASASDVATAGTPASDSAEALAVFRDNIDAIHKRDRPRYLATYLQTAGLTRTGLRGQEKGWEGWDARTQVGGWPDTLIARELQVTSVSPGVVYGTYRYIGVNKGVAATGISMRVFVRTPQGMRIAITGSWPDTLPVPAER